MAESFLLLVIVLLLGVFLNRFLKFFDDEIGFLFLIVLMSALGYGIIRYIFSGIEYVTVFDKNDFKKKLKKIFRNGFKFVFIFFALSSSLKFFNVINFNWYDIFGLTFIVLILIILMNYISLCFSFKKNGSVSNVGVNEIGFSISFTFFNSAQM
ncbi:hypothetical protein [Kurthia zopfii]|uniref:hypothetical protein n=1 Tax=Kurthia zopfii TaxID=1650 RepID=UPI000F6B3244|nr:hypothetical protein [Kurthia zopfii]VEI06394.1 Uncharacterised protein [Kurthia zopfii]